VASALPLDAIHDSYLPALWQPTPPLQKRPLPGAGPMQNLRLPLPSSNRCHRPGPAPDPFSPSPTARLELFRLMDPNHPPWYPAFQADRFHGIAPPSAGISRGCSKYLCPREIHLPAPRPRPLRGFAPCFMTRLRFSQVPRITAFKNRRARTQQKEKSQNGILGARL